MTENYRLPILINGYQEMVNNYVLESWKPYLLSFMFKTLHGSMDSTLLEMQDEIYRCYRILIRRFARNPRSPYSQRYLLPRLFAFPDRPVPKYMKTSLRDVTVNGGLHYHGILLVPPVSRFKEYLLSYLARKQSCFVNRSGNLARLDANEITHEPGYVVGYGMKSLKRRTVEYKDVLILPKCVNELPSARNVIDPEEQAIKDLQSHWNCSDEVAEAMLKTEMERQRKLK
jgi:hypothetical protein